MFLYRNYCQVFGVSLTNVPPHIGTMLASHSLHITTPSITHTWLFKQHSAVVCFGKSISMFCHLARRGLRWKSASPTLPRACWLQGKSINTKHRKISLQLTGGKFQPWKMSLTSMTSKYLFLLPFLYIWFTIFPIGASQNYKFFSDFWKILLSKNVNSDFFVVFTH